jgi:hypothetical protein
MPVSSGGRKPPAPHPAQPGLMARPATDWLWGAPVELPELAPVAATPTQAGQPASPPGPGTPPAAGRGVNAAYGRARDRGKRSGAVGDLLPPDAGGERPGPAGAARGSAAPPRVTIGTIEVTVVPPAPPPFGPAGPAQVAPEPLTTRPPAASPLAEDRSARLRGGLRRWYGIAHG